MATLTVRNLEDDVVRRLRVRAAEHGRSAEAEHREILRNALAGDGQLAARRQVAERLAEFRRRTGGRGAEPVVELLAEVRAERLRSLTGDERGGVEGA
jgi:plasmid stability protein